jgi:hypothetical protein
MGTTTTRTTRLQSNVHVRVRRAETRRAGGLVSGAAAAATAV